MRYEGSPVKDLLLGLPLLARCFGPEVEEWAWFTAAGMFAGALSNGKQPPTQQSSGRRMGSYKWSPPAVAGMKGGDQKFLPPLP
ncbi:unnamed protein product [Victoria cruziana]